MPLTVAACNYYLRLWAYVEYQCAHICKNSKNKILFILKLADKVIKSLNI